MNMPGKLLSAFAGTLAIGALVLTGCGGDDDGGGGSALGGSDERYVADICAAGLQFQEDLLEAIGEHGEDEERFAEALAEQFERLAKAFSDARPPNDIREWHESTTSQLDEFASQLKAGRDLDAIGEELDDSLLTSPPEDAAARLQTIAANNSDCEAAGFSFEEDGF